MNKTKHFKRTALPVSAKSILGTLLLLIAMLMPQRAWAATHYDAGYASTSTTYDANGITFTISGVRMYNYQGNNSHFSSNPEVVVTAGNKTHTFYLGSLTNSSGEYTFYYRGEGKEDAYKSGSFSKTTYSQTQNGIQITANFSNQKNNQTVPNTPGKTDRNSSSKWCTADLTIVIGVQTAATVKISGDWRDWSDGVNTNSETYSWTFDIPKHTCNSDVSSATSTYLKNAATCTAAAVYNKSCSLCGAAQSGTFTSGSALGHSYGAGVWKWEDDGHTATCTRTCGRTGCTDKTTGHTSSQTVTFGNGISRTQVVDPTCTENGTYRYSASAKVEGTTYTSTLDIKEIAALGHGTKNTGYTPTWTWGGKYNEATCTFALKCNRCKQEVSKQNLTPTKVTDSHVDPTCAKNGNERWTVAAVSYSNSKTNDASYTGSAQTEDYAIPALGHTFAANDLAKSACQRCNHGFFRYKSTTGEAVVPTAYNDAVFLDENNKTLDYTNTYVDGNGVMECERPIVTIVSSSFRKSKGFTGDLIIPNTVKTIGSGAFELTEFNGNLIIPNSVTSIGESAFCECKNLTGDITIPNSVTSLEFRTFYKCSGFNGTLTIPNSITRIERDVFFDCKGLTGNLTIPNSVTSIGQSAFYSTGFTGNLSIPNSVTSIGNEAFSYCEKLSGTLTLPNSITSIGERTFSHCPGLTGNLTIPNSVTSIGVSAFFGTGFTGNLTIPNSVISIGNHAFRECNNLTGTLNLGNSVKSIGSDAFLSARLTGVLTIPNSVTDIGNTAFSGCKGFTCVTFESVPKVGNLAFSDITTNMSANLCASSFVYKGSDTYFPTVNSVTAPCTLDLTGSAVEKHSNLTINHGESAVDEAIAPTCTTTGLTEGSHCDACHEVFVAQEVIPALGHTFADNDPGQTYCPVCEHTFFRYTATSKVTPGDYTLRDSIGNNIYNSDKHTFADSLGVMEFDKPLATIGESAFFMCDKFTGNLTIPNSVTSIGDRAFSGCSGFTGDLTIPNSVTRIGNYAFSDCSGFTGNLTIGNSVTSIGVDAFFRCSGFTGNLTIPNSVTSIGNRAFYNCFSFTGNLIIPNSVTSIGDKAFYGCSGFTGNLTIGNSVTSIGNNAFWGCSGFTGNLTIPNSVTSIGVDAFFRCSGFTGNLTIGNSVTSIGNNAFNRCSGFSGDLTIPNSVTSIGEFAFENCSGFNGNLTIPNSVTSIGNEAFYGCSGFTGNLTIPNSVTSIGNEAFYGCSGFTGVGFQSVPYVDEFAFTGVNCSKIVVLSDSSYVYKGSNPDFPAVASVTAPCTLDLTGSVVENHPNLVHTNGERIVDAAVAATCTTTGLTEGAHCNLCEKIFVAQEVIPATGIHTFAVDDPGQTYCPVCEHTFFRYTSSTNEAVAPYVANELKGANGRKLDFTNTYVDGHGVMEFKGTLKIIGNYAFWKCSSFTGNLTIPNSVTSIGNNAFQSCSGFNGNLTIPNSVTSIGTHAFYGCSGFKGNLTIPNSVTSIGTHAFDGCSGFKGNLTIGNSVTSIGNDAFYNCYGFKGNLTIGNSVTSIGNGAFYACSGFTGVEFQSVPLIEGSYTFNKVNCSKTVVLSDDSYVYTGENPNFPKVASVTYNRNLAAGKTVTFMLPFDVTVENINGKVYELSGFDGETLSFSKPADGIAHANKPYLLTEPEEGNLMISPVSAISAGNPQTIAADNAEMWGTYTKQTGIFSTDRESIYGYAGGEFVRQQSEAEGATKGATLKPFRALIKVRELENGAPAARLALCLDEETIGVISISDDELNTRPVNVYDMNGRLVRANVDPMTCLKGLPKGIYVVKTLSAPQGGTSPMKERVVYKQCGE